MQVAKYRQTRFFAVYDAAGELVVVTVYKRGAQEVVRRLTQSSPAQIRSTAGAKEASAKADASHPLSSPMKRK